MIDHHSIKRICFRLSKEVNEITYEVSFSNESLECMEDAFYGILEEELEEYHVLENQEQKDEI